ncbi:OmpP1/FadL family transporter [Thioclava sp. 15-R06ZXC-3]|uniref:OmpP1/FadL family transporter n=1 Tax=Thioclava arctica TaxID=3238301 RepID=A0ABV3TLX2_9RHOB
MKRVMTTAAVVALSAGMAQAGGVERSTQSTGILFEKGNYAEFNIGGFNPDVSGSFSLNGSSSGDMAPGYGTYSLGYKQALSDKIDVAIVLDQPIGANVGYPTGTGYPLAGSTATISSNAITGLVRYKLPQNFSVYGGLRIEQAKGEAYLPAVNVPAFGGAYSLKTSNETDVGYVIGVAWEKPEIAARVALTYNSKIDHKFTSTEWGTDPTLLGASTNQFTTTVPESINLEFQTGIAKDTLLMGSVRWVHWTQFNITPPAYNEVAGLGALVDYNNNSTSWTLGVGRRFNDQWSGAVMFGYEKTQPGTTGNLGPTDGYKSVSLAASYQATDNIKITGGLRYVDIGDAKTNPIVAGTGGDFSGNSGWGAGVRVGINF